MGYRFILIVLQVLHCAVYVFTNDVNLNDLKSQLSEGMPEGLNIPQEFANVTGGLNIPQELSNVTVDDIKSIFKDKCDKLAGEEAYIELEKEVPIFMTCIADILNTTAIQAEIIEARPKGELDAVFNKYCRKRPDLLKCIDNLKRRIEPCLDTEETTYSNITMRIATSLLNFICHKDGDQIALFIAEKGPECLESSKDEISNCLNSTFSKYVPQEGYNDIKQLPRFVMGPNQCRDFNALQDCIVKTLEKCEEITPANIIESMFRFIRNETTCIADPKSSLLKSNTAQTLTSIFGLLVITMIATLFTY